MTAPTSKLGEKMDEKEIRALAVKHRLPMITRPGEYPWSYIDNVMAFATELLSASQPAAIDGREPTIRDRARWFVRDFSRDVGFAMSDAQTEVMLNLFLRYAAPASPSSATIKENLRVGAGLAMLTYEEWACTYADDISSPEARRAAWDAARAASTSANTQDERGIAEIRNGDS